MKRNQFVKGTMVACMLVPVLSGCSGSNPIELKSETVTIEYGEKLQDMKEYLKTDSMDKEVLEKTTLDAASIKIDDGKDYPALGEYTVTFKYEDSTKEMKVKVQDTTKPVFESPKTSLETYKDVKLDFTKEFNATDLSEVTITADDSQVDYSKEGSYKASVIATDKSGNAETVEVTVKVNKPAIKLDKTSKSMYVKENFVLKADIKGKDDKATFKSSSTSVATVDANGKVTAKKKGTATITASANGVEATCKITVKNAPNGSTTTTKTVTNPTTGKKEEVVVVEETPKQTASISMEAFNLINNERINRGLKPLSYASDLESIALARAKELTIDFSHDGMDKYDPNYRLGEVCTKLGSNNTASHAVNNWMNSTAHRNILMDSDATYLIVSKCGNCWEGITK